MGWICLAAKPSLGPRGLSKRFRGKPRRIELQAQAFFQASRTEHTIAQTDGRHLTTNREMGIFGSSVYLLVGSSDERRRLTFLESLEFANTTGNS
jgi:hypothetical protein